MAARAYYMQGNVFLEAVPPLIAGAAGGAMLGSNLALHLTEEQLRWCFSGGMVMIGVRVLLTR